LGSEVRDLIHHVFVLLLKHNFTQIELAVDETRVMGEFETLRQLDSNVVDHLDVGARHVNSQVQIKALDRVEDVASIVIFDHGKVGAADFFSETVEGGDDIRMGLQLDPLGDVFLIGHLPHDELLSEVLVVHDVRRVANHVFHLAPTPSSYCYFAFSDAIFSIQTTQAAAAIMAVSFSSHHRNKNRCAEKSHTSD